MVEFGKKPTEASPETKILPPLETPKPAKKPTRKSKKAVVFKKAVTQSVPVAKPRKSKAPALFVVLLLTLAGSGWLFTQPQLIDQLTDTNISKADQPRPIEPVIAAKEMPPPKAEPFRPHTEKGWMLSPEAAVGNFPAIKPGSFKALKEHIQCLAVDYRQQTWAGTDGNGLWMYSAKNQTWQQYTKKDGLADNFVTAVAVDRQERVWAGHLHGGISVFNAGAWRQYDITDGPIGGRVFDIAVSPVDGATWIATNAGISRWDNETDSWRHFTRAEGLPEDQVQTLAISKDGRVYAGTQCHGIAISDVTDDHTNWRVVRTDKEWPAVPHGEGLPTNLINDVLVANNGRVWAATSCGLAWSDDKGESWDFIRGKNWKDKIVQSAKGAPKGWKPAVASSLLKEDYVRTIAEDDDGNLWLGYWTAGFEALDAKTLVRIKSPSLASADSKAKKPKRRRSAAKHFVTALHVKGRTKPLVGMYGHGLQQEPEPPRSRIHFLRPKANMVNWPSKDLPNQEDINALQNQVASLSNAFAPGDAVYLGEDWLTQGDWVGRYGRHYTVLFAHRSPADHTFKYDSSFEVTPRIGPHFKGKDVIRRWCWKHKDTDRRVSYDPRIGIRRPAGCDDHAEVYSWNFEGPDIWTKVKVPEGIHRASLYFLNYDGTAGNNRERDYLLEVRPHDPGFNGEIICRTRVRDFQRGVYKQFLLCGPAEYDFKIGKNHSFNTMLSALMIDKRQGPKLILEDAPPPAMGGVRYHSPELPTDDAASTRLWNSSDTQIDKKGIETYLWRARLLALRQSQIENDSHKNSAYRWRLPFWTQGDRNEFVDVMTQGWHANQRANPFLQLKKNRPHSPNTYETIHDWTLNTYKQANFKKMETTNDTH